MQVLEDVAAVVHFFDQQVDLGLVAQDLVQALEDLAVVIPELTEARLHDLLHLLSKPVLEVQEGCV